MQCVSLPLVGKIYHCESMETRRLIRNFKCLVSTALLSVVLGASSACQEKVEVSAGRGSISADETYTTMVATEEVIGDLTGQMSRLKRAIKNLDLSWDPQLFTEGATFIDVGVPAAGEDPGSSQITFTSWTTSSEESTMKEAPTGMWTGLLSKVLAFDHVGLGTLKGTLGAEPGSFSTDLKVSLRGVTVDGKQGAWKGKIKVSWLKENDHWLVSRIESKELGTLVSSRPLFSEVLDRALTTPEDLTKARDSIHDRYIREVFFTGGTKFAYPKDYWIYIASWDSLDQHTSVSVVDIDRDGWDDFYVTARWGRNQLWRNRGDGTFEDIAGRVGLDLDGVCNCSLFADFDNDGDQDVFIGRSLERGRYYVNVGGRFEDQTDLDLEEELPYWTSSMASADVNGDGLLDLYISTYRLPISKPQNILARQFLSPEEQEEWKRRRGKDHPVFRLTGPPNVLLINQGGGRFKKAIEANGAELWLSSFQATWSDYDNDGDPDLFVANDYAPDFIFRNDEGKLTDVTHDLAGDELQGFGMGVTLGDYNNDGLQDPYFTYMYSKAGSRITSMFEGLEKRMYEGVTGNKLLKNKGESFEATKLDAAKAGWSWGGQFADLDNDGFLDLYVANGLYTPPAETETAVDL